MRTETLAQGRFVRITLCSSSSWHIRYEIMYGDIKSIHYNDDYDDSSSVRNNKRDTIFRIREATDFPKSVFAIRVKRGTYLQSYRSSSKSRSSGKWSQKRYIHKDFTLYFRMRRHTKVKLAVARLAEICSMSHGERLALAASERRIPTRLLYIDLQDRYKRTDKFGSMGIAIAFKYMPSDI